MLVNTVTKNTTYNKRGKAERKICQCILFVYFDDKFGPRNDLNLTKPKKRTSCSFVKKKEKSILTIVFTIELVLTAAVCGGMYSVK